MPLRILQIERNVAGVITPRVIDDAERYPPMTVRLVREWLGTLLDAHRNKPPTPQLIQLSRPELGPEATTKQIMRATRATVSFEGVNPTLVGGIVWQPGTAEVLERNKRTGSWIRSWEFVIARDIWSGRVICGPALRDAQRARDAVIEVASL